MYTKINQRLAAILMAVIVMSGPIFAERLRFATYNITVDFFDKKGHPWAERKSAVMGTIVNASADVISVQEVSPEQALELSDINGFESFFLSQTPSDIPTGEIVQGQQVGRWVGRRAGTPLVGFLIRKDRFDVLEKGRFWLTEKPHEIPQNLDRSETDKGFGNMNTYRAVFWMKLQDKKTGQQVVAAGSHYPLSGNHNTRLKCAELERAELDHIAQGLPWVSMGDRNIIPSADDPVEKGDVAAMMPLISKGAYDAASAPIRSGFKTTFAGFTYDDFKNPIAESGRDFVWSEKVLDVIASNHPAMAYGTLFGQYQKLGFTVDFDPAQIDPLRRFASDHMLVYADYDFAEKK